MNRRDWALVTPGPVSAEACLAVSAVVDADILAGPLWGGGGLYFQQSSTGAELTLVQSLRIDSWASLRPLLPVGYTDPIEGAGPFWWTEAHSNGWDAGKAELLLAGIARVSEGWAAPLGHGDGEFSPLSE